MSDFGTETFFQVALVLAHDVVEILLHALQENAIWVRHAGAHVHAVEVCGGATISRLAQLAAFLLARHHLTLQIHSVQPSVEVPVAAIAGWRRRRGWGCRRCRWLSTTQGFGLPGIGHGIVPVCE